MLPWYGGILSTLAYVAVGSVIVGGLYFKKHREEKRQIEKQKVVVKDFRTCLLEAETYQEYQNCYIDLQRSQQSQ